MTIALDVNNCARLACGMLDGIIKVGEKDSGGSLFHADEADLRVVSGYLAENIPLMIRQPHTIYVKKGTPISNDEIDNALNAGRIRKAELEPLFTLHSAIVAVLEAQPADRGRAIQNLSDVYTGIKCTADTLKRTYPDLKPTLKLIEPVKPLSPRTPVPSRMVA